MAAANQAFRPANLPNNIQSPQPSQHPPSYHDLADSRRFLKTVDTLSVHQPTLVSESDAAHVEVDHHALVRENLLAADGVMLGPHADLLAPILQQQRQWQQQQQDQWQQRQQQEDGRWQQWLQWQHHHFQWQQDFQREFARRFDNVDARTRNALATRDEDNIHPLYNDQGEQLPNNFPRTRCELTALSGGSCNELLGYYGLPGGGSVQEKKGRLQRFFNVPPPAV